MTLQEGGNAEAGRDTAAVGVLPAVAKKKIMFVTRTHEFGGAERHLIDLLNRLGQRDLQITVVCFAMDPYTERLGHLQNLAVRALAQTPDSIGEWISFFRSARVDTIVFVHGWSWNFHWMAPIGAWIARVPRRYSIQHLVIPGDHDKSLAHRTLQEVFRHINLKISASTLHTTICVSEAVRRELVEKYGFPAKSMKVIRNGVSLSEFQPSPEDGVRIRKEYGISREEFLLVCAARLSEQKGIDILLNAMANSLREGVRCKCIIVGHGPLQAELVTQSRQLGLEGQVFFAGFREDIRPYFHASTAFIMTSHREGLPLAILEAMACGLPCIVTDVGGNREAVADKVNGLLITAESPEAAAQAIRFLVGHPEQCREMSRAALARVQKDFDIEQCVREIKKVILN